MTLSVRHLIPLLAACALGLGAAACGGDDGPRTAADVPPNAVALIGEEEIPRSEFDELMERAKTSYKSQQRPFPKAGTPEYNDLKNRAVAFLVQRYQWRAEAEEMGVEASEEEVDKKLEELKQQSFGGDEKKFQEALKKEGLTEEQARAEVRDRVLQEELYAKVTEDIKVTDKDAEEYYEKNKSQFSQPASRDVRHIVVKNKDKADELYSQIQGGADFAQLARQNSTDDSSAKLGGKIPVTKGSTVPPFDKVAFDLDRGEVSKPVKTTFGWHIIKADSAIKPEQVQPLDKVRKSIEDQLSQQKKNEELERWLKDLEKKYENEIVYATGFAPPKTETGETSVGTDTPAPADTTAE